ncbi:DUF4139 domain-containing protein [Epilithonimonas mollis]|uniref:Mucoidy inhibitor MuiA family protein n=1 Tax=Epilithonimonas mollis TaxID=216903 RepID=A0A1M6T3D1_9FLAO|nr:DUF4139 domain-containing protein [Epilithonimonas mollis]SHK51451.1 conserved hypothetical protein [Epilithonimonas mollis]
MKRNLFFILFLIGFFSFAQKPIFVKSKVSGVSIYRTSAELQSSATFNIPAGPSEVVITNISEEIEEKSIQINSNNPNVAILSVQFSDDYKTNNLLDKTNPKVKSISDSLTILDNLIAKANVDFESQTKTLELLDKNQTLLVGSNSSSVAQLIQLTDYYKTKRTEISLSRAELQKSISKFSLKQSRLRNSLNENANKEENISDGVLVIKILSNSATNVKMDISYLAQNVSWQPFYEIKGNKISEPLNVLFKAKVRQDTGLDWKDVRLSLINGYATRNNNIPVLNPWFLNSYEKEKNYSSSQKRSYKSDTAKTMEIEEVVLVGAGFRINENQLNTSFDVDIPYNILSNNEDHFINLKQTKIPAIYKYVIVPKQSKDAFLIAKVKDFNQYNLIPGTANVIFENMYVGETNINPNQITDELDITLGNDKKISVVKQTVDDKSSSKMFSSYQEKTFTYDIIIRNNKKDTIDVEVKDQIPLSTDDAVKIELLQSDNAEYDKEKGYLTWNMKIPASETKKIRVSYKVRYPKDYSISNLN